MTGWDCPECGAGSVCSVREWSRVYNWRAAIAQHGRRLANTLTARGMAVKASEEAADLCRRWADQHAKSENIDGPEYICANCHRAWSTREVAG